MMALTCAAVRRSLQAFHDGELAVGDQIAVGAHLEACRECTDALADLRAVGGLLRAVAAGHASRCRARRRPAFRPGSSHASEPNGTPRS